MSVLDTTPPVITLRGDAIQNVLMGAPSYSDPGAVAYDAYEGTLGVTSSGVVDPTKQGDYIITYNAIDGSGNSANPVTRTVRVLDTLRPVISLNGAATVTQEAAEPYTDPGATALDNGDTPVAVSVSGNVDVNTLGSHVLTYNASDASGNAAVPRTRTVIVVDTQAPVITLNGSSGVPTTPTETEEGEEVTSTPVVSTGDPSEITVEMGGTFVDPGAIAVDAFDGVVEVTVSGSVDTSKAGTYPLTYLASDSSGNVATPTVRTVRVADTQAPVIVINGDAVLNHEVGQSYTDAGAEVQGENLPITTEGEVDVNTLGHLHHFLQRHRQLGQCLRSHHPNGDGARHHRPPDQSQWIGRDHPPGGRELYRCRSQRHRHWGSEPPGDGQWHGQHRSARKLRADLHGDRCLRQPISERTPRGECGGYHRTHHPGSGGQQGEQEVEL